MSVQGEAVTLGVVQRWIDESESTLRASMRDAGFPAEWESQLEQHPPTALIPALQRWALLKHFYRLRAAHSGQKQDQESTVEAARQLLRREPVITTLAGRRVEVTGRSYNALVEISTHFLRIRELTAAATELEQMHGETLLRFPGWWRRRKVRRRLAFLANAHAQAYTELLAHRRALYAHAMTRDGAPAAGVDAAPSWWAATTADDDVRLLIALYEVGPSRFGALGEPPKKDGGDGFAEDFGFHSLLTWLEGNRKLPPAALYDQDVGQILTALRAGTLNTPEPAEVTS